LIFFVHPGPKGSEENQFTSASWRNGVNKLIFERGPENKDFILFAGFFYHQYFDEICTL
jgi:hypothetical protein